MTYTTSTAKATATATTATTATTTATGPLAALVAASTLTATGGTLGLGLGGFRLAGQLDGDLALQNLLTGELLNSGGSLLGGGQVHEGVAHGTVGARVHRDGDALTGRGKGLVSFDDDT